MKAAPRTHIPRNLAKWCHLISEGRQLPRLVLTLCGRRVPHLQVRMAGATCARCPVRPKRALGHAALVAHLALIDPRKSALLPGSGHGTQIAEDYGRFREPFQSVEGPTAMPGGRFVSGQRSA